MSETKHVSVNFPFFGILTLIFITLKLTGYITWSWWWVLAPMWLPIVVILGFFIVSIIVIAIASAIGSFINNKKRK